MSVRNTCITWNSQCVCQECTLYEQLWKCLSGTHVLLGTLKVSVRNICFIRNSQCVCQERYIITLKMCLSGTHVLLGTLKIFVGNMCFIWNSESVCQERIFIYKHRIVCQEQPSSLSSKLIICFKTWRPIKRCFGGFQSCLLLKFNFKIFFFLHFLKIEKWKPQEESIL